MTGQGRVLTGQSCQGHVRACTHLSGVFACPECVRERAVTGQLWCDDLDNCGGPGCMDDESAPARVVTPSRTDSDSPASPVESSAQDGEL